ncbi:hypothetical protein [Bradyrhizobium sp. USDA 4508]
MDRLPDFRIRQVPEDAKEDRYGRKALLNGATFSSGGMQRSAIAFASSGVRHKLSYRQVLPLRCPIFTKVRLSRWSRSS